MDWEWIENHWNHSVNWQLPCEGSGFLRYAQSRQSDLAPCNWTLTVRLQRLENACLLTMFVWIQSRASVWSLGHPNAVEQSITCCLALGVRMFQKAKARAVAVAVLCTSVSSKIHDQGSAKLTRGLGGFVSYRKVPVIRTKSFWLIESRGPVLHLQSQNLTLRWMTTTTAGLLDLWLHLVGFPQKHNLILDRRDPRWDFMILHVLDWICLK